MAMARGRRRTLLYRRGGTATTVMIERGSLAHAQVTVLDG
jgi:hypothetical protein